MSAIDLVAFEKSISPSKIDRLPPHSLEAEAGILGCIFLCSAECLPECIEAFQGEEVFYDLRHRELFGTLVKMSEQGDPIDILTVSQNLKDRKLLDDVGGLAYLASLPEATPSANNSSYYIKIVWEKHLLRKTIQTCGEAIASIYDSEESPEQVIDTIEERVMEIRRIRADEDSSIQGLVRSNIQKMEQWFERKGKPDGVLSGFTDLDALTYGFRGGEVVVIAARPSVGKSSLVMQFVEHAALEQKIPVGVFSLEMSGKALVFRLQCSRARVDSMAVRRGELVAGDFQKLTVASSEISKAPIHICDRSGLSISQLRARSRRMVQRHGIKMIVIDYLQLMGSRTRNGENREREVAQVSNGLKAMAKELDIPVVVAAQLNRDVEKTTRKPRSSDLRESGAIEQDADTIGLLYRPGDEAEHDPREMDYNVNLLISKQREGPTGEVALFFRKRLTRFENAVKTPPLPSPRFTNGQQSRYNAHPDA